MRTNLNEEMRFYLKDVSARKVLTRQQEVDLFARLKAGDDGARAEIVEANLRFVIKIALQFAGRGVAIADLIQEGNIGLLEVVGKFDHTRGFRFSTYAAFWIRQSIQMAVRKQCNVIRLPIRKGRFLGHLTEAVNKLTHANNGRTPTVTEIGLHMDIDPEKLEQLMKLRDSVLSLDMDPEEDGGQLLGKLTDEKTPSPMESCMARETTRQLTYALDTLSEKERKVLKLRFGFGGGDDLSLRGTSKLVGMSQEGVRRVERAALKKLRRPQAAQMIAGLV